MPETVISMSALMFSGVGAGSFCSLMGVLFSIVTSLLRGEDAELLSREHGVTIADISHWRDQFVESGTTGFKRKPDDSMLSAAERKIGTLLVDWEDLPQTVDI